MKERNNIFSPKSRNESLPEFNPKNEEEYEEFCKSVGGEIRQTKTYWQHKKSDTCVVNTKGGGHVRLYSSFKDREPPGVEFRSSRDLTNSEFEDLSGEVQFDPGVGVFVEYGNGIEQVEIYSGGDEVRFYPE